MLLLAVILSGNRKLTSHSLAWFAVRPLLPKAHDTLLQFLRLLDKKKVPFAFISHPNTLFLSIAGFSPFIAAGEKGKKHDAGMRDLVQKLAAKNMLTLLYVSLFAEMTPTINH